MREATLEAAEEAFGKDAARIDRVERRLEELLIRQSLTEPQADLDSAPRRTIRVTVDPPRGRDTVLASFEFAGRTVVSKRFGHDTDLYDGPLPGVSCSLTASSLAGGWVGERFLFHSDRLRDGRLELPMPPPVDASVVFASGLSEDALKTIAGRPPVYLRPLEGEAAALLEPPEEWAAEHAVGVADFAASMTYAGLLFKLSAETSTRPEGQSLPARFTWAGPTLTFRTDGVVDSADAPSRSRFAWPLSSGGVGLVDVVNPPFDYWHGGPETFVPRSAFRMRFAGVVARPTNTAGPAVDGRVVADGRFRLLDVPQTRSVVDRLRVEGPGVRRDLVAEGVWIVDPAVAGAVRVTLAADVPAAG